MSKAHAHRTKEEHIPTGPGLGAQSKLEVATGAKSVHPEAIGQRAYERFLARDCVHGHDFEDWCAAEAELLAEVEGQQV